MSNPSSSLDCSYSPAMNKQVFGTRRIREHPELEGTHQDHRVQLLFPHRTTQKSVHSRTTRLYSNKALLFCLQMPDIDLEGPQQCYFPLQITFFIPSFLSAVVTGLQVKSAFPFNTRRVHILLFLSGAVLGEELDLVVPVGRFQLGIFSVILWYILILHIIQRDW